MGYLRVILAAASILVLGGEEAQAQFSADLCKNANTTILVVKLRNGFKEVFALSREGSKITGRVQAWQVNGITAGRGNVTGSLGAPQGEGLTLQIRWEGRSDIDFSYFKGILHNGEAQGTASDLNRPFNPVDASAATACRLRQMARDCKSRLPSVKITRATPSRRRRRTCSCGAAITGRVGLQITFNTLTGACRSAPWRQGQIRRRQQEPAH